MNDLKTKLLIQAQIHNNSLCLTCSHGDNLVIHEKKILGFEPANNALVMYYFWWMLNAIKPFFFKMPVDDVQLEFSQECKEKFEKMLAYCYNVLKQTNDVLKQYDSAKASAGENGNVLFFNIGENINFKKIYSNCHSTEPNRTRYLDYDPGFNPIERRWEKKDPPFSVEAFVRYIRDNSIQKIVSINHYLLEKYLDQGIYILALFRYLDVEYIIIDLDNYDLSAQGYQYKQFYNVEEFKRFSYAEFHRFWDRHYHMSNVRRIVFPHEDKSQFSFQDLDDDYNIVIMSNSRLNDVLGMLNPIVFVLSHFKEHTFFEELSLWYYSLRHLILDTMDLNEYERLTYNGLLLRFAYNASQFAKYIVIDSIESDRQIRVYGDTGWQTVFPEYYQSYLDREGIDTILSGRKSVNLLMNWQLTWFETSAVIFEALNYRVPFLNHPAVVKTQKLEGMAQLEYKKAADLNHKLDHIKDYLNDDLLASINYLNSVCNQSLNNIVCQLEPGERNGIDNHMIPNEFEKHDALLLERINAYTIAHQDFLRYSFKSLFHEPAQYDLGQSEYVNKPFMQRLIRHAQNQG